MCNSVAVYIVLVELNYPGSTGKLSLHHTTPFLNAAALHIPTEIIRSALVATAIRSVVTTPFGM